jgi:hypothetical protein
MSFFEKLQAAAAEAVARNADPWRLPLERLNRQTGDDGLERLTTQAVLDILQVQDFMLCPILTRNRSRTG